MSNFEFETPSSSSKSDSTPQKISDSKPDVPLVEAAVQDVIESKNPFLPKISVREIADLPSVGLAYPKGYSISYRPYTLGEIDQLENSQFSTRQMYEFILRGIETSFSKEDLTLADTMYLGLLRRLASMGSSEVLVTSICPACQAVNQTKVLTQDIEFEDLSVPQLPINLETSAGLWKFTPVNMGDYFKLIDLNRKMDTVALLAVQCRNLEFPKSIELFEGLAEPSDIAGVRQVDRLLFHGLKPLSVDCVGATEKPCHQTYKVQLENASEAFIMPFRRQEDDPPIKITFG